MTDVAPDLAKTAPSALWRSADDRPALTRQLADHMANLLAEAVLQRGRASLVVPGGRTPAPVFEALAARDLPWASIAVTLSDERWVDAACADSNEHLLRETLLKDRAAGATFVPLKRAGADPNETLDAVAADVAAMPRPFDVVLLGMGADGHFASLFPGGPDLSAALDPAEGTLVRAVTPDPLPDNAPYPRISLTASALFDARSLILLATGEDKRQVLDAAASGAVSQTDRPVRALFTQRRAPLTIFWSA